MLEAEFHIADLITRHLRGSLGAEDQLELDLWINASQRHKAFFEACMDEGKLREDLIEYRSADLAPAWTLAMRKISFAADQTSPLPARIKKLSILRYASIAAVLLVALSIGLYFFISSGQQQHAQELAFSKVAPGGNKAYLILSGGKRIVLDDVANGQLAKLAGVVVTKTADGQLVYKVVGDTGSADQINTMETPRGGQYQLVLPDGTHVWLNSSSKLVYPISFAGRGIRKVQLSGEAYFEVAKDKTHPFVVESKGQEVEVLGTHFNVNSYTNEPNTETTLLEGSVSVNGKTVLKPGEQSVLAEGKISVLQVDAENFVDWKNGEFVFVDEPLGDILRKVSRWYDVEFVVVDRKALSNTFTGSVSRSDKVSGVLRVLQKASKVRFRIEGKVIRIE